jgi:hypothetical protein
LSSDFLRILEERIMRAALVLFVAMTRRVLTGIGVLLAAGLAVGEEAGHRRPQHGYTTTTLREPVVDAASVDAEARAIAAWLGANHRTLTADQTATRQHLYFLIESRVKDVYAREGRVFPKVYDPVLATLFSWAEPLGGYGGALVYNALRAPGRPAMTSSMTLPPGFTLALRDDLLELRSRYGGWSVTVPYYFMIWNITDVTATDGVRTQMVALSTGAVKDNSAAQRSQATLALMFSPGGDAGAVESSWRKRFGITGDAERISLGVRGLVAQRTLDNSTRLYKEFATWTERQGPFAVIYAGPDGAYQWNRPHFLDFLRAVEVPQRPPPI